MTRMFALAVSLAVSLAVASTSAALAQSPPTREQQAACRGDAVKLCSSFVGKPAQMNACLVQNKAKLSDECRKVVEAAGG